LALTFSLTVNCFTLSKPHRLNKRFSPEFGAGVVFTAGLGDTSAASLGSARLEIAGMTGSGFVRTIYPSATAPSVR
jgi:hypothetical protein